MSVGDDFFVNCIQFRAQITVLDGGELQIGTGVFVNQGANIAASKRIIIGDHCMIGDLACIYDTDFHAVEDGAEVRREPVTLGRNVWLARGAMVLAGVSIGENSVVAAGAVVVSSVPANSLVAGNPARVIRALNGSVEFRRKSLGEA